MEKGILSKDMSRYNNYYYDIIHLSCGVSKRYILVYMHACLIHINEIEKFSTDY